MTKANVKRLYDHFCFLAKGEFDEDTFKKEYGDGGSMTMGRITKERKSLIITDAKTAKAKLEKQFPELVEEAPKKKLLGKK